MSTHARLYALLVVAAVVVAGCSSSGTTKVRAYSASSARGGAGRSPADVDVCALLSPSDANSVAHAHKLNSSQTASTVYKLTATKQKTTGVEPSSACLFMIAAAEGGQGTVGFVVTSAKDFSIYAGGKKVSGLGDEAYDENGATVVRVGNLMISAGEDSFTQEFTTDLLRKMAPKLK